MHIAMIGNAHGNNWISTLQSEADTYTLFIGFHSYQHHMTCQSWQVSKSCIEEHKNIRPQNMLLTCHL